MGITAILHQKNLTRCGVTEPASRELPIYHSWYVRFVSLFGLLCLVTLGAAVFNPILEAGSRVAIAILIGALMAAFWFFGKWDVISSDGHAIAYLTFNLVAISLCIRIWDGSVILLFAAYWMAFAYLYTKPAIVYAVALTLATQWGFGTFDEGIGWNQQTLIFAGLLVVIIGFSTMMASYIEAFQREADKNRGLLEQLRSAQSSLIERERMASVESERRRLAGEIHDTIAQHFASVITNLNAAHELDESHPDIAKQHVSHAMNAAQQGITDSRALLGTMQPVVMEGRTLDDVLETIATTPQPGNGPTVQFVSEGEPVSIGRVRESLLVRALQESLRNTRKHANAADVNVTLTWLEDEVLLDVSDNGAGFDPDTLAPGHNGYRIGLTNMKARIEEAGGTFVLDSTPNEGTSVTISFSTGDDS